ncbi:uncharacterized protein MELLADRAFT_102637 [Melampsora larici-populina 98AG31]|uniref:DUF7143 domain-containing protein n=1 Tax=Melampsora larici-populina (strain 98AG31 / pathotype 3-4-7) TaxID=747676 RepID=F4R8W9_MELLP|nr:uncharacterized protein MELLADRAFT_102637 [Melampsora larici-populina 98AG31]EGG11256.1 hypothetical protein MELLADRAFT_102637 [Melampsora larici-populina 98AG31]
MYTRCEDISNSSYLIPVISRYEDFSIDVQFHVRVFKSKAFDSLNALPDVEFGKDAFLIRFTAISFLTDTRVSSVRFAINHFPITQDREYLVNAMTLYGAINAGLRSLGDRPSGIFLGPLKGVEFFLEFQVNCKDKDILGRKGAQRNYFKSSRTNNHYKMCYRMYIASLFLVSFFSGPVLVRADDGAKPCFLVGSSPLPSDVKADSNVKCIPNSKAFDSLSTLPDVEFGEGNSRIQFTTISFLKDTRVSAVKFAMKNFPITLDRQYIVNALAVYDAINAGLRSIGEGPAKTILKNLKGVSFFLGFQLHCKDGDVLGRKGAKRNYLKTVKNCVRCTDDDKTELRKLGLECKVPGI